MKLKSPLASVILVNFNGKRFLNNCLKSIFNNSYSNFEVVVVDNKSSDDSLETLDKKILNDPRLKIIKSSVNTGPTGGLNLGAKNAKGKYIAILGYDTEVDKDWLKNYVEFMEKNSDVGIAQGKIMRLDKKDTFSYAGDFLGPFGFLIERAREAIDKGQFDSVVDIFGINSASMIIPKGLFNKIGGFDEDFFMYLEETDLCFRTHLYGKRVVFFPGSTIYHNYSITTKEKKYFQADMRNYYGCRNYILTLEKNLGLKNLVKIMPFHFLAWAAIALMLLFKANFGQSYIIFKAILWHLFNIPTIIKKRSNVQQNIRKVSDSYLDDLKQKMTGSYYFGKAIAYMGGKPY